jgi:hypothetical protein
MNDIRKLISAGYALVPIPYGKKGPITAGWNERKNAITHPADAKYLDGKNIGLAHAYCTPTPTCAIDIDDYKSALSWLAARGIDLKLHILAPDAVAIWSGKKNSLKLIYRLPESIGALPTKTVKNANGSMVLEFRCASADGKTVQDVLPPSLHPAGEHYRWMGDGCPERLTEIPEDFLLLWKKLILEGRPKKQANRVKSFSTLEETPHNIARVKDLLQHIDADCSYEDYRAVIWAIESLAWNCSADLQLDWSTTAPDRFSEQTLDNLTRDFNPGDGSIGFGTLVYIAMSRNNNHKDEI